MRRLVALLLPLLAADAIAEAEREDPNAVEEPEERARRIARIDHDAVRAGRRLLALPIEARINRAPPWGVPPREGELTLVAPHTEQFLTIRPFDTDGNLLPEAAEAIESLFACRRSHTSHPIDPRLVRVLHRIAHEVGSAVEVLSGYRAPGPGQRAGSLHASGRAADIRVPGLSTAALRDVVYILDGEHGPLGVGYYPLSKFVHVDVREESEHWVGRGARSSVR